MLCWSTMHFVLLFYSHINVSAAKLIVTHINKEN